MKPVRHALREFLNAENGDGRTRADELAAHIFAMSMARIPRQSIEWMRVLAHCVEGLPGIVDDDDMEQTAAEQTAEQAGQPNPPPKIKSSN